MSKNTSTFPSELSAGTRIGLASGAGLPSPRLESLAEAEIRFRQERLLADAARSRRARRERTEQRQAAPVRRSRRELMTRWTSWLPFVPLHHSSVGPQSSSTCGC
jgi:hypothetical protein